MRALASDPLRNFKFIVSINPTGNDTTVPKTISKLGFMTVSGLGIQNEVIPYREGGDNTTTRKMPGQSDFGPITLGKGMLAAPVGANSAGTGSGGNEIWQWFQQIFSLMEGAATGSAGFDFRADVTIDILEHPVTTGSGAAANDTSPPIKARFHVYNAWPMGLAWSDLDAGGNAIVIETLQLAHEGFQVFYAANNLAGVNYVSSSA